MKFLYLYVFTLFTIVNDYAQVDYKDQKATSEKVIRNGEVFNDLLHQELVSSIFPYWYGTQWDFNGYTNVPNDGVIACGYFVSTTLKHIGFNLNRYDIAKMYSSDIVKVLCFNDYWVESDYQKFLERMEEAPDGLYIVGLSNHVGFIERCNGRTYFIHSNYIGDNGVERELAYKSDALSYSTSFWVGNFSNNALVKEAYLEKIEFKKIEAE
jgi:hypothetical protein